MVIGDTFHVAAHYSLPGSSDELFDKAVRQGEITYEAGAIISRSPALSSGSPDFVDLENSTHRRRFAPLISAGIRLGYLVCVDLDGHLQGVPDATYDIIERVLAKQLFVEAGRQDKPFETSEEILMSYVDPTDGKTYYSFDDGKTFEPMTDEEFEARFPTPNVEWWTYDECKAWLDNEKVQLQSLLGESGTVSGRKFIWTQEEIDKTIAMYEDTLADIKSGIMYSKSVDGQDEVMMSYTPADISTTRDEKELYVKLDNGEEYPFGPYETNEELLAAVKPFCEKQVRLGNMEQSEANEIIARHSGK